MGFKAILGPEEGGSSKEKTGTQEPAEIKTGSMVRVKNDRGEIEEGWMVGAVNAVVSRKEGEELKHKVIPKGDLASLGQEWQVGVVNAVVFKKEGEEMLRKSVSLAELSLLNQPKKEDEVGVEKPDMEQKQIEGRVEPENAQLETKAEPEQAVEKPKISIEAKSVAKESRPGRNEDAILQVPEKNAFGVFDGMGGHEDADKASSLARESALKYLQYIHKDSSLEQTQIALRRVLEDINKDVLNAKEKGSNMGTTGVIGKIWEGEGQRKAIFASVGDSPAYLLRGGRLEQITLDDNLATQSAKGDAQKAREIQERFSNVATEEDFSKLTAAEKVFFNLKNDINQALGFENITPHVYTIDLQPGDRLLLVSDGVSDNLTCKEIEKIMTESSKEQVVSEKLTEAAQNRSRDEAHIRHKADDISVLVVEIPAS